MQRTSKAESWKYSIHRKYLQQCYRQEYETAHGKNAHFCQITITL